MKVHVVMIHHRHGINLSAHDTAKGAEEEVLRYVEAEWAAEAKEEYPESNQVEAYFEKVESEWFEIEELTIQAEEE
jgi:hypothetical protein